MKRIIALVLATVLTTSSLFALDLSLGANFDYNYNLALIKSTISVGTLKSENTAKRSWHGMGFDTFLDLQYLRIGAGMVFSSGGLKTEGDLFGMTASGTDESWTQSYVRLSFLGKFPFSVGDSKIYPLLGLDLDFNLSYKDGKLDMSQGWKKKLHHYYLVGGLGADLYVGEHFFITPKALVGYDLKKNDQEPTFGFGGGSKPILDTKVHKIIVNAAIGFGYRF